MPATDSLLDPLLVELARWGVPPAAWALAWARFLPTTLIVPAFGLRVLSVPGRAAFALVLAASIAPTLSPLSAPEGAWLIAFAEQALLGLPVALGAAIPLWGASMSGNVIEAVRGPGATRPVSSPLEPGATPVGTLLSLGACAAFLKLGGPAAIGATLATKDLVGPSLRQMAASLVQGIHVSVLLGAPILALSIFFDAVQGLATRIHGPSALTSTLSAARSLGLLAMTALLLDRLFEVLVRWILSSTG